MSKPLTGVVISHAGLASALVEAVQAIVGDSGPLVAVSNVGASRDSLCRDLASAVGDGPAVVFVDMPGGSCLHAALTELRNRDDVAVVAGVNLPMLLDFAFHREMGPMDAARHAQESGTRSIRILGT
jgi:mannose/fructose-specific phosphotransferase system component IIA